jgi:hypothetical protein
MINLHKGKKQEPTEEELTHLFTIKEFRDAYNILKDNFWNNIPSI